MDKRTVASPLERVLVATDFSPSADRAAARAIRLPLEADARILLLHVLPSRLPAALRAEAEHQAKYELGEIARALRPSAAPGIRVETRVAAGDAFAEILRAGRTWKAELTLVGRHGQRAIRDLFLGSTAERVVRHGAGPVLVVTRRILGAYRRPLLALDADRIFLRALALAPRVVGDVRVGLVHAYDVPLDSLALDLSLEAQRDWRRQVRAAASSQVRRLLEHLPAAPLLEAPVLREGAPPRVILEEVARRRADLLILGSRGRTGLPYLLLGSVAGDVIREAPCDLLVVRPNGRRALAR